MSEHSYFYRTFLIDDLGVRTQKNPQFSLRAYARLLNVSPSLLSEVINGKRTLSNKVADRIVKALGLKGEISKRFIDSVSAHWHAERLATKARRKKTKPFGRSGLKGELSALNENQYEELHEWYCITILEMMDLDNFRFDISWIATELGIQPSQVQLVMDRLFQMGFVEKYDDVYVRSKQHLRLENAYTATSEARRRKQIQVREKMIEAIMHQPVERRSATSLTLAIDPERISEAKDLIQEFNEKMCSLFESGKKEKVYCLEVGLFSLHSSG